MSLESLADAFLDELRDVLSAEKQLTKALPKMAKKATSPQLKKAFESHLAETETWSSVSSRPSKRPARRLRKTCEAMKGLLKEGSELMGEDATPEVMDALLIAAASEGRALRDRHLRHALHLGRGRLRLHQGAEAAQAEHRPRGGRRQEAFADRRNGEHQCRRISDRVARLN